MSEQPETVDPQAAPEAEDRPEGEADDAPTGSAAVGVGTEPDDTDDDSDSDDEAAAATVVRRSPAKYLSR